MDACTLVILEELRDRNPNLMTRKFNIGPAVDPTDNGLRVPRLLKNADKKEKKKKK